MLPDEIKQELVARITSAEAIDRIILFGSKATATSNPNSDIDLLVVLDCISVPASFQESSANYLRISFAIRQIEKKHPIDLLVYTRPEFEQLKASNSLFVRQILNEGIRLS